MTTTMTSAELLAHAETLRKIQHDLNRNEGLALSSSAWGDLKDALLKILAEAFVAKGADGPEAVNLAELILDACYDNGEDIAYQMKLLASGQLSY